MTSKRLYPILGNTLVIALFYTLFVSSSLTAFKARGIDILPPEAGDGVDYEHIAFNLWQGRGYSLYWSDDNWRAPYLAYANTPIFRGIVERQGSLRPTAYRPPLYPLTLSGLYSVAGRNFFYARLLQFWFIFGAVIITAVAARRYLGVPGALAVLALASFDPSLPLWAYYFLTEPLAMLLSGWMLLLLMNQWKRDQTLPGAAVLGIICGLLVLTRSITILWLPFVLGLLLWPVPKPLSRASRLGAFTTCLFMTLLPWIVRNVQVIAPSAPLGTQGGVNLAADYSDSMIRSEGVWLSTVWDEVRKPFRDDPALENLQGVDREVVLNEWGARQAKAWLTNNLAKVPTLMWLKLKSLWWTDLLTYHVFLGGLTLLSLLIIRNQPILIVPLGLLCANTIAVMLTHNVPAGRFMIPVLPSIYMLVSALIVSCLTGIRKIVSSRRSPETSPVP